jgi:hypothetical protein
MCNKGCQPNQRIDEEYQRMSTQPKNRRGIPKDVNPTKESMRNTNVCQPNQRIEEEYQSMLTQPNNQ